jgi:hypothetical protein
MPIQVAERGTALAGFIALGIVMLVWVLTWASSERSGAERRS